MRRIIFTAVLLCCFVPPVFAALAIPHDQVIIINAAKEMAAGDYKAAEASYSKAIAVNASNANAYLQRALARRELGDAAGMTADAKHAVALVTQALSRNATSADLYYQRSLGKRLLKQFDDAEHDLRQAIQLNRNAQWDNDLKALQLERKMAK